MRRIGGTDQISNAAACPLDNTVRFLGFAVAAATVRGTDFALIVINRVVNGLGLRPGCRGIIKVNAMG